MEASAENHNTTNNMTGVASYVEKAAEEDIKAKLIMEINDLKQLLGGRKAQVESLSAEKVNLQQKVNQLQEHEHKCSNHNNRHPGPGSVSCSFPTPIPTQINGKKERDQIYVKVVEEMQLDALKLEAMARGMDTATVIPMTKDTLLNKLVIGTTCISKSTVWSTVVSLRRSIENEKDAICAREEDEKQLQLDMIETKCEPMREKCPRRKRTQCQCNDQHGQCLDRSRKIVTNADANRRFTRTCLKAHKMTTPVTCQTQLQSETTPPPAPVKRPRKKFKMSPSSRKQGSVFSNNAAFSTEFPSGSYLSLADKEDGNNTHPSHAIIRRDILEAFVAVAPKATEDEGGISTENKRKLTRQRRYAGFVGFRCRYCKDKHINKQADLAIIYPESINGIYRANIRFQSKHIQACPYIPKQLKDQLNCLKTSKTTSRGKKTYWTKSALQKGFCDWQSPTGRKGIIYRPPELK